MRAGRRITSFISNEDINDIVIIINSLKDSNVFIDGVTETGKVELRKTVGWIFLSFVSTFSCSVSVTTDFFSNKRDNWKRS